VDALDGGAVRDRAGLRGASERAEMCRRRRVVGLSRRIPRSRPAPRRAYLALARAEVALASGAPSDALSALDAMDGEGTPLVALLRAQASSALERWDDTTRWLQVARTAALEQGARPLLWRIGVAEGSVNLARRRRLDARRAFDAARADAAELLSTIDEPDLVRAFRSHVDAVAPPAAERTRRQSAKAAYGGLTRRERETAALVADGKSNRLIARSLGIGERTVEGYVAAALSKLGFASRSQLAVWAAQHGLGKPGPSAGS
jgi:DNA-binding CsgD family transcriptional regulator